MVLLPSVAADSASPTSASSTAAKKARTYSATIQQTKHGIPHITGKSMGDLGFGSGYMAADASACTLLDTLITARGNRSLWFGPDARYDDQVTLQASNLQVDAFVTDLRNRRVVEQLLADKVRGRAGRPGPWSRATLPARTAGCATTR